MNIVNFTLATDLNYRRNPPLVFTTQKSLHERFTPKNSQDNFIIACDYLPQDGFSSIKRKLVVCNRRYLDLNEQFKLYKHYNFEILENRTGNRKRLAQDHCLLPNTRRIVIPETPATFGKITDNSKKYEETPSISRLNKSISFENSYSDTPVRYNSDYIGKILNSAKQDYKDFSENSFFDTPIRSNKFYSKYKCFNRPTMNLHSSTPISSIKYDRFRYSVKKDDDFAAINSSFDANGSYKVIRRSELYNYPWYSRNWRSVRVSNYSRSLKFKDNYEDFKNRRMFKATSPYHYLARRESLYRKRQVITKEQLDEEIDRYMSEFRA